MEDNEVKYEKGFNNGYLIAKHEPELYSTVTKGLESKNDYLDGFLTGGKEYEHEKNMPNKSHGKDKGKDRDKGIDHDR